MPYTSRFLKSIIVVSCLSLPTGIVLAKNDDKKSGLSHRVERLEQALGINGTPVEVTLTCPGGSISEALASVINGVPITINIDGTCTEDVVIAQDDVTIQGVTVLGGEPQDTLVGHIIVVGAARTTIRDLVVRDGDEGVFATQTGSMTLENLRISGHANQGVGVNRNAQARIIDTVVENPAPGPGVPAFNALFVGDGGHARISGSTFISNNAEVFNGAAVGLFRVGHVRFDGANVITNQGTNCGSCGDTNQKHAIDLGSMSQIRINPGGTQVNGNVRLGGSQGQIRDATITGNVGVGQSILTLSSGTDVNGNVDVFDVSILNAFGSPNSVEVSGTVTCAGPKDSITDSALDAGGGVVSCDVLP